MGQLATTLFGFDCKDPFAGTAEGSHIGEACGRFFSCSTCPGAVVVLDSPHVVAKLLATTEHLRNERARASAEGWAPRFQVLYGPTLTILERDLLPLITDDLKALAQREYTPPLPRLE